MEVAVPACCSKVALVIGKEIEGRDVLVRRRRRHSSPDMRMEKGEDDTRKEGESPGREGRCSAVETEG